MQTHNTPPPTTSPLARLFGATAIAITWLIALTLLVLVFLPASGVSQWLSTRMPVAQAIAFPVPLGIALLVFVALVLLVALLFRSARRRRGRSSRMLAWFLAPVVLLGASGTGLLVSPAPHYDPGERPLIDFYGEMVTWRIVTLNSQDTFSRADLDQLMRDVDPDVIVLPEASPERLPEITSGTAFAKNIYQPLESGYAGGRSQHIAPTSVLVHERMPEYEQVAVAATTFGSVKLANADSAPDIVAVHAAPPVPGYMGLWRSDLHRIIGSTDHQDSGHLVVAGDFNATLRHGPMTSRRNLIDVAQFAGNARQGTWPAVAPLGVRTPIDHVLVSDEWSIVDTHVRAVGQGDHLALVTELTRIVPFD